MSDETTNQLQPKLKSNISSHAVLLMLICCIGLLGFYFIYSQNRLAIKAQALQEKLDILHINVMQQQLTLQQFAAKQKNHALTNALLLSEISYLIKTANLSLIIDNDVDSALKFLTAAKQQLISQPEFSALNSAIVQDIATLQAATTIDTEKLVLRLATLQQQLTDMNVDTLPTVSKTATSTSNASTSFWQRILNSTLQELRRAIIIKHENTDASPLTSEQLAEAKLNIQFKLSQAELALMQQNPALYQSALQSAHTWLRKYFPSRDLKELQELQTISIPTKPNIQASLKEILNYKF